MPLLKKSPPGRSAALAKLASLALLALGSGTLSADDQNPELSSDQAGYALNWSGEEGRTYFVQYTTNLADWRYFPIIYPGDGSPLSHGFGSNAERFFTRLAWTDLNDGGDPPSADFDQDGLESWAELTAVNQTDPLNPDTDGDGLFDGWEQTHGLDPTSADTDGDGTPDGAEDPDGDGADNATEQESNSDPNDHADRPHQGGTTFGATQVLLDLDVDSDNNNGFENPDRSLLEDVLEASEPKVLLPNNADSDNDGLIDFADGFNLPGFSSSDTTGPNLRFTPILVELGDQFDPLKARVKFTYSPMSEPRLGGGLGLDEEGNPVVVQGGLRLWNCPADSRENGDPIADGAIQKGDFIPSDTEINWREIVSADGQRLSTLYLEYVDTPDFSQIGTTVDLRVEVSQTNEGDAGTASETFTEEDIVQIGLLPVEIVIPKVDSDGNEISGELVAAKELKVGKMENAHTPAEGVVDAVNNSNANAVQGIINNPNATGTLDIDSDKDRFFVRIRGGASLENVSIKLGTIEDQTVENPDESYRDDATEIEMMVDGDHLITKSLLLVSDDADDDYSGNGVGEDDQKNDRTHKVQLDGEVQIESVIINGVEDQINLKTRVPAEHVVDMSVVILRRNGAGVVTAAKAEVDAKRTAERYAQIQTKIVWNIQTKDPPGGLDLTDGLTITEGNQWFFVAPEARILIENLGSFNSPNRVTCFYVDKYTVFSNDTGKGTAIADYWYADRYDPYINNFFLVPSSPRFTQAHELGHLVTDEGHVSVATNLMVSGGTELDGLNGNKRLTYDQQEKIEQSSLLKTP